MLARAICWGDQPVWCRVHHVVEAAKFLQCLQTLLEVPTNILLKIVHLCLTFYSPLYHVTINHYSPLFFWGNSPVGIAFYMVNVSSVFTKCFWWNEKLVLAKSASRRQNTAIKSQHRLEKREMRFKEKELIKSDNSANVMMQFQRLGLTKDAPSLTPRGVQSFWVVMRWYKSPAQMRGICFGPTM